MTTPSDLDGGLRIADCGLFPNGSARAARVRCSALHAPQSAMKRLFGVVIAVCLLLTPARTSAARVKDLALVEGGRDNQLVGYGLVVGLAGDGDSNAAATLRAVANTLQRYGISVNAAD